MSRRFTYFDTWGPVFDNLGDGDFCALSRAMYRYGFYGEEPDFEPGTVPFLLWQTIWPTIETSVKSYEKGDKGGRPKSAKPKKRKGAGDGETPVSNPGSEPPFETPVSNPGSEPGVETLVDSGLGIVDVEGGVDKGARARDFALFLKSCVESFNRITGKRLIDAEISGTDRMLVQRAFDNGRTVGDFEAAVAGAMERWEPGMVTFRAIFKGANIAELASAAERQTGSKRRAKLKWPPSLPCPECGAASDHVGGGTYSCPGCGEFGRAWQADESQAEQP